ncbi:ATP-binding protein [Actinomycetaceae bacterium WB03_NA08]|uniref:ATP-binding protein n=1 Tax=Scrofimicrobium canadense TaxID=2652290 RepID=A0A6N7WAQ3_9ACTO|nr:ATP-binding protein [Scrofimicrobium canadense]MSS85306.1 ATP-binding protein [Scrofimicrobium canadense]
MHPPALEGRSNLIDEFLESIEDGPGAPGRLTLYSGPRGIGKTVMLNAVGDSVAERMQWLVIHETATPGFTSRLAKAASNLLDHTSPLVISGITLPVVGGGIQLRESPKPAALQLREALTGLSDQCRERGTGLLITSDEIPQDDREEMVQFAAVAQHLVRESCEFALVMAGVPSAVDGLLNEDVTTFMRRAERHDLTELQEDAACHALSRPMTDSGKRVDPDAMSIAVKATEGYPFLIQLIGYQVWRRARDGVVDLDAVRQGVGAAQERIAQARGLDTRAWSRETGDSQSER